MRLILKKIKRETLNCYWSKTVKHRIKMNQLYSLLSIKQQSFHQMRKRGEVHLDEAEQLLMLVNRIRKDHPCMSVRDIYFKLNPQSMGRDKFEQFCCEHVYRVKERKNFRITKDSRGVARFPNLIEEL